MYLGVGKMPKIFNLLLEFFPSVNFTHHISNTDEVSGVHKPRLRFKVRPTKVIKPSKRRERKFYHQRWHEMPAKKRAFFRLYFSHKCSYIQTQNFLTWDAECGLMVRSIGLVTLHPAETRTASSSASEKGKGSLDFRLQPSKPKINLLSDVSDLC